MQAFPGFCIPESGWCGTQDVQSIQKESSYASYNHFAPHIYKTKGATLVTSTAYLLLRKIIAAYQKRKNAKGDGLWMLLRTLPWQY